jgi:dipeptidyl aminopeptidase
MQRSEYTALAQESAEDAASSSEGPLKPEPYYGEGPFDPPSSDDEDGAFVDKGTLPDAERSPHGLVVGGPRRWLSPLRVLLTLLAFLVLLACLLGIYAGWVYQGAASGASHRHKQITMDHVFNGTFRIDYDTLAWVPEGMG